MADTTFVDGETLIEAAWLNDVNTAVYNPAAAIIPASSIVNTPAGNIEATDVQTAINELDTEKQPLDADLTAIAALTTDAYGRSLLTTTSEANFKATVNLEIGTDVQAYSANIPTAAPGTSGNILTSNGTTWVSSTPVGSIVAWVNFNGTGVIAERAKSSNVSLTDNGVGDYTITFSPALSDANYLVSGSISSNYGVRGGGEVSLFTTAGWAEVAPTTTAFRFVCTDSSGTAFDPKYVQIVVYR